MLARQYTLGREHEKEILLGQFAERAAHLDNLLARVTEHVDAMRIVAETDLLQSRNIEAVGQPVEFQGLADVAGESRYELESFPPPMAMEMIGSLTGAGSIEGRDAEFYRDIHMALGLNPLFRATAGAIPDAAWIYFTSCNNFINIYPWVSSRAFRFSLELYTHEFYTLGLPDRNPERKRFWTRVYADEYGKGLMTTCAAPVYDGDRFAGTVAIDLTVDFLNTVVKQFSPRKGVMLLVNDNDQLLAHPWLVTSHDAATKTLEETLPEPLRKSADFLKGVPEKTIKGIDSYYVLRSSLGQAPWEVFFIEEQPSFVDSLFRWIGFAPLAIMIMLSLLVAVVFAYTQSQFIRPSKTFVHYIMERSRDADARREHRVPGVWVPWFAAIDKVFSENEKLTKALRNQNEELERMVKRRTEALVKEIEERKRVQETLRKSEERFRDISYSMADWIWEIDDRPKYTFTSETVTRILGYSPEEMIGKKPLDFVDESDRVRVRDMFERIRSERRPIVDMEQWKVAKDGRRVCLLTNGFPIFGENGKLIGYRGVHKDITAAKAAEKEQKKIEERLRRAERMELIGTLAGGVAHDLNNILAGIVGYPDMLLLNLPEDSPFRKPVENIRETGLRVAAIVQDMLTLARRGVAVTEVVNMNDIVRGYLNSPECEKLKALHPKVRLNTRLGKDLLNILGSPVHLTKSVMNLVGNAAEAMPDGGQTFISTENRYIDRHLNGYDEVKEGDYVAISVSDTGEGICPEDRQRIFEPFYTKKVMGRSGTGLGLAVVWGTVKDHAGYIDIQSDKTTGTVFTLYFPATRQEATRKDSTPSPLAYKGNGESILVVDDVLEQREIAEMLLARLGYRVATVSSGEEAVEYVKGTRVDLLILDMIMEPGMDGLDTYRKIIEINPGQRAIIASGFSENERVREAQRLGAGTYVRKPYTLEKIGMTIKEELSR